ncbi:MAG: DUF6062 family protein [Oscillospiraceae bacterium]|nr:DUF6062 family protein [Oscillospiraceae bacterium]
MKEQIYTIQINEAFDQTDGCPICRLTTKRADELYEYILGAAMMEPDVRVETNKKGFCQRHLQGMFARPNKLSFALILESLLMEINKKPEKGIESHKDSCYLCEREKSYQKALASNIAHLWRKEQQFARKFDTIEGFCMPHANVLCGAAVRELGKKHGAEFCRAVMNAAARRSVALEEAVSGFCKSFDHRNADVPFDKQAVEKACKWLGGE